MLELGDRFATVQAVLAVAQPIHRDAEAEAEAIGIIPI
jgi:hypothetical protein